MSAKKNVWRWVVVGLVVFLIAFGYSTLSVQAAQKKSVPPKTEETQEEILTNDSVVQLVKLGLPEDLVIAKIQATKVNFNLTVEEMTRLNKQGVSPKILGVMMAKVSPLAPSDPNQTSKGPKALTPHLDLKDGVYIKTNNGYRHLKRQISNPESSRGWRSFNPLDPFGASKVKAVLEGPRASERLNNDILFVVVGVKDEQDFTLVRLEKKKDKRQIETQSIGGMSTTYKQGFPKDRQVEVETKEINKGVYELKSKKPLKPDEYAVFVNGEFYPFGVDK